MNNSAQNDLSDSRKRAEDPIHQASEFPKEIPKKDLLRIVHELNIRQHELEEQNEELLTTQHKLEQSQLEYINLFDYAPVGHFILNEDGVIQNVNITGSKQLGIDKLQLFGKHFSTFIDDSTCQDNYYHNRQMVLQRGTPQGCECTIRRKDGSVFAALIETNMLKDENEKFKHFHSMLSDITEQTEQRHKVELALSKEKELNELKSRFISMASHEFRTPLAAILSSVYLLEKYNTPEYIEKRQKHLDKIKNSISGLNEILIDFLSLSQIEKGTIKNNPETFNLVKFIEEILEEIKSNNQIHTFIFSQKGERQDVFLDKKLLRICLTNLLGNAVKYSPSGGTIEIITEQNDNPKSILISVKDEGIGIPENDKDHIFEQFFRAKNVDVFPGTGLGLNIIKKLVTLMDGNISFKSKINTGTIFSMEFFEF